MELAKAEVWKSAVLREIWCNSRQLRDVRFKIQCDITVIMALEEYIKTDNYSTSCNLLELIVVANYFGLDIKKLRAEATEKSIRPPRSTLLNVHQRQELKELYHPG